MPFLKRLKILLQSNLFYIVLFFFVLTFVFIKTKTCTYATKFTEADSVILAQVQSFKIDGDKLSLYLKERETFVATYYFKTKEEKEEFSKNLYIGSTVKVEGNAQEVANNSIPNTFNYKKYLEHKKIYFSFLIQKIEIEQETLSFYNKIKQWVQKRIRKLDNNPYLQAFILGDKSLMEFDVQQKIQTNGVSHLFALSGMHVSFFVLLLDKLLKKWSKRKWFIYLFLTFYLFLTSFPVSFVRAILLMLFLDINHKFSFGLSSIKILFLIAALLLFINPFFIYDLGFLYSFIVTFSLLYAHKILEGKGKIKQLFLISCISFLFSLPISIYSNYEINLFSIINNIFFVPYVSMILFPFSILTFFIPPCLSIFSFLLFLLEKVNDLASHFSFFLVIGKISFFEIGIYYSLLLLFIQTSSKKILCILLFFVFLLYNKKYFDASFYVYFFDVGQGDSILLTTPRKKKALLIDTGGTIRSQKEDWQMRSHEYHLSSTIITFLKSQQIRELDTLLLTHGDYDHMGESFYLINHFPIKKVIFNINEYNDLEKKFIEQLKNKNIFFTKNKGTLKIEDYTFYFLNTQQYTNENDNSNVVYTKLFTYSFLFMGDAGIAKEKDLLEKYNLKDIDFFKVGHHGSNTSSSEAFISAIQPKYSFISVGKNNRYGHPKKEVLHTLASSKIYRTDIDGTIEIKFNQKGYTIKTYPS